MCAPFFFLLTVQVKLSVALKLELDSAVRRNVIGLRIIVYGLVETTKQLRRGGQPIVTRTPIILTEHVVCLFMFSNQ